MDRREWKYILVDGIPTPVSDAVKWAMWWEEAWRSGVPCVRVTLIATGLRVSTVFLSLDANSFGEGPAIHYETLVFGGTLDGEGRRASTRDEALENHRKWVETVCLTEDISLENAEDMDFAQGWDESKPEAGAPDELLSLFANTEGSAEDHDHAGVVLPGDLVRFVHLSWSGDTVADGDSEGEDDNDPRPEIPPG